MQLKRPDDVSGAESAYWDAYERLALGRPLVLPPNTPVTQNNVAKEAGRDPSALRKDRYPALIRAIQEWILANPSNHPALDSSKQKDLAKRRRARSLREKIEQTELQRDAALSLLVHADAKILDLTMEVARLEALAPPSNVRLMARREQNC